jgi:hypothetical protein
VFCQYTNFNFILVNFFHLVCFRYSHLIWFLEEIRILSSNMKITRRNYLIILISVVFLSFLLLINFAIQDTSSSLFHVTFSPLKLTILNVIGNRLRKYKRNSTCIPPNQMKPQVKFYKLSSNHSYHYEYLYELSKRSTSSSPSRLIVLLAGWSRKCIDW